MKFIKDEKVIAENIPFGAVEVSFPDKDTWNVDEFYTMAGEHIEQLKASYSDYERKAVFGEYPYYRYFKKFKKTYPVMMQLESILLKGRPFPNYNPVTEIAFLVELETRVLLGTHDVDRTEGDVTIKLADGKIDFPGMKGDMIHTYPGDIYGEDNENIILGMIGGADDRTCVHEDSMHVFYPVFGLRNQDAGELKVVQERIAEYVKVLAPNAEIVMHLE